jgi:hypothetical protein
MDSILETLGIHRFLNGRSELDYFTRRMKPRYALIEINGKFFDRDILAKKIKNSGRNTNPESLEKLSTRERNKILNTAPYRILGKAKILPKNK